MDTPSAEEIRNALVARAEAYCEAAQTSLSAISLAAVKDSKFLGRLKNGEGFHIRTYQRVNEWLDEAERKLSKEQAA